MRRIKFYLGYSTLLLAASIAARAEEATIISPEIQEVQEILESSDIGTMQDIMVEGATTDDAEVINSAIAASDWPKKKVLKGKRTLLCIGVKYLNATKVVTQPGCQFAAEKIAEYYRRNSNGLLTIKPTALEPFEINMKGSTTAYKKAVEKIKATYPGYNYYVIPGVYTYPHAGGKVAHVKSAQLMTAFHEVGHLLGLGHAGSYAMKNGTTVLNAYGDTDSIMGRVISKYLTAPQYYYLGWLPAHEVVLYDPTVASYEVKKIGEFSAKGLSTVIVPTSAMKEFNQVRPAFISASRCDRQTCVSLHLLSGGGSQKVAEFRNEYYDSNFTGLHIKVLSQLRGKLRIAIDFDKKPAQ